MVRLIFGDCKNKLKELSDNSIDTIITDPPYGLSFMGKKWDYDVPGIDTWKECLRVTKPGGTALIFAGTRTQHRMAVAIEDAGWILKDCIMWLYGSGFPKATDISKQLDKGHKREVVGKQVRSEGRAFAEGASGFAKGEVDITIPKTDQAKLWNGWKSHGLKPAYEPILVAMKPNDGSYANNTKHGVSGLNIDGARIGYKGEQDKVDGQSARKSERHGHNQVQVSGDRSERSHITGRFPANIILDEEAARMLDEQSGVSKSSKSQRGSINIGQMAGLGGDKPNKEGYSTERGHADKGGASRFFYVAKASKRERNMGCEGLEKKANAGSYQFRADGSLDGKPTAPKANSHPTVKPLKLMEYLCLLTKTPTGGTVLDPFMGSGTTGMACKLTGREFIGIEKEKEYLEIAKKRIEAV